MSLIKCPECDNSISDKASACPHCGFPIRKNDKTIKVQAKEGCFLQTMNLGCAIIILFVVLTVASFIYNRIKESNKIENINNETKDSIIHNNTERGSR